MSLIVTERPKDWAAVVGQDRQVNFIKEFSEAFNVPVFVEQDARAGALAQFLFNPELSEGSLAYYLLGEGIGLGIIDNGSIYYGAHGTATRRSGHGAQACLALGGDEGGAGAARRAITAHADLSSGAGRAARAARRGR